MSFVGMLCVQLCVECACCSVQGLLTHEVDEGSPCTKCIEGGCPGFSLHFWRCVCVCVCVCVCASVDVHTYAYPDRLVRVLCMVSEE